MRLFSPLLGVLFCLAPHPGAAAQSAPATDAATFGRPHLLVEHLRDEATVIASGDLDQDGDADFYVGTFFSIIGGSAPDVLLLGEPGPRLIDASDKLLTASRYATADAVIADLDGDGMPDILTGNMDGPVTLLRNQGAGVFLEDPAATPVTIDDTRALALVDLQLDGDLDVWVGNAGQDRLLVNAGGAVFGDLAGGIPMDGARTDDVVFVPQGGSNGVFAYVCDAVGGNRLLGANLSDASPAFGLLPGILPPGRASELAAVDIDGDGDWDIASTELLQRNDGGSIVDISSNLPFSAVRDFDAVDVDGDGDVDLFGPATLFLNDGGGAFSDASSSMDTVFASAAFASTDIDNDGDLDAFASHLSYDYTFRGSHSTWLLLGNGEGRFDDVAPLGRDLDVRILDPFTRPAVAAVGDLDGDRYDDVIIGIQLDGPGGTFEQKTFLYGNDGSGRFLDRTDELGFDFTLIHDIELADIEGDGDLDAILGGHSDDDGTGGGVLLKRNDGASGFVTANGQVNAAFNETNAVALGDVDLDGDVDILQSNEILYDGLLINDGFGIFDFDPTLFPAVIEDTLDALLVDVDGDGDLDALSAGAAQVRLARNNGSGLLVDDTPALPFALAGALSVGDLEGDGDLDVALSTTAAEWLWRNDPTGFVALAPGPGPSNVPVDVLFADFDANGADDVLFSGRAGTFGPFESRLLWNDGTGDFTESNQVLPDEVGRATALVAGDLDGDGDIDLMANSTPLFHLGRQLAARGPAALGKDLHLVVSGKPGAPFLVVNANTEVEIPIGAVGVLRLGPGSLSLLATGSLGNDGSTVLRIALPMDLALLGQTGLAQAGIGFPLRLSSLERVAFTDL